LPRHFLNLAQSQKQRCAGYSFIPPCEVDCNENRGRYLLLSGKGTSGSYGRRFAAADEHSQHLPV
jgi:hypothetical protein